jgi:hypothetical protein
MKTLIAIAMLFVSIAATAGQYTNPTPSCTSKGRQADGTPTVSIRTSRDFTGPLLLVRNLKRSDEEAKYHCNFSSYKIGDEPMDVFDCLGGNKGEQAQMMLRYNNETGEGIWFTVEAPLGYGYTHNVHCKW